MKPIIVLIDTGVADWVTAEVRKEFGDFDQHQPDKSNHGTQMADLLRKWAPSHRLWSLRSYVPLANSLQDYEEARRRLIAALTWCLAQPESPHLYMIAQAVTGPDFFLQDAIQEITEDGACVIAAALQMGSGGPVGPDGIINTSDDAYPGTYPEVVSVAYADKFGWVPDHSAIGWTVDLAAGGDATARGLDMSKNDVVGASVSTARVTASLAWSWARNGPCGEWWEVRGRVEQMRNKIRNIQKGVPVMARVVK